MVRKQNKEWFDQLGLECGATPVKLQVTCCLFRLQLRVFASQANLN